jgi:hypothetical protein
MQLDLLLDSDNEVRPFSFCTKRRKKKGIRHAHPPHHPLSSLSPTIVSDSFRSSLLYLLTLFAGVLYLLSSMLLRVALVVLLTLLALSAAEYPMAKSIQNKRFFIYPLSIDNWYAFPV